MAEFPELGQHCAFENCKQLDFLPFHCFKCEQDYCTEHRLPHAHNCRSEEADNSRLPCATGKTSKPFCCSYGSCATTEFVKVVCPHCELNYCLAHRHSSDHQCAHDPSATQRPSASSAHRPQPPSKIASTQPATTKSSPKASTNSKVLSAAEQQRVDRVTLMKLKMKAGGSDKNAIPDHQCAHDPSATQCPSASSVHRPQPPSKIASTQPATTKSSPEASTNSKVLSAAEQQRVDRVTLMKLKMKAGGSDKNAIPDSERLFLLVILPDSTEKVAVLVSKKWTVGRCFDQVIKLFNVNQNCDSNSKKLRLYIQHCSEAMNMSDNISDAGAVEGSTLELRHE